MAQFMPLFAELFNRDPLPLRGVEILALQLSYFHSQGEMWEAFKEAAQAAPRPTQQALEDWLQNHWNQLSRTVSIPDYEQAVLTALRQQIDSGEVVIHGVDPTTGIVFTRSTED